MDRFPEPSTNYPTTRQQAAEALAAIATEQAGYIARIEAAMSRFADLALQDIAAADPASIGAGDTDTALRRAEIVEQAVTALEQHVDSGQSNHLARRAAGRA